MSAYLHIDCKISTLQFKEFFDLLDSPERLLFLGCNSVINAGPGDSFSFSQRMEPAGDSLAPDLVLDDKSQYGFVQWFQGLPQASSLRACWAKTYLSVLCSCPRTSLGTETVATGAG